MPQVPKINLPPIDTGSESIGERLARFRKEKGYTQEEVAQKIGIKQVLISKYERDKLKLSDEMLFRFAKALEVNADEILGLIIKKGERSSTPSLRILKRVRKIEKLPLTQQKALLKTIDMVIKNNGK